MLFFELQISRSLFAAAFVCVSNRIVLFLRTTLDQLFSLPIKKNKQILIGAKKVSLEAPFISLRPVVETIPGSSKG